MVQNSRMRGDAGLMGFKGRKTIAPIIGVDARQRGIIGAGRATLDCPRCAMRRSNWQLAGCAGGSGEGALVVLGDVNAAGRALRSWMRQPADWWGAVTEPRWRASCRRVIFRAVMRNRNLCWRRRVAAPPCVSRGPWFLQGSDRRLGCEMHLLSRARVPLPFLVRQGVGHIWRDAL
jgi:hypothetical protein